MPQQCLVAPFIEAAVASNRSVCTALAQAWVAYLHSVLSAQSGADEGPFVEVALTALEMLGAACTAAGSYPEKSFAAGDAEIGMGVGAGERPHAQVSVEYCTVVVQRGNASFLLLGSLRRWRGVQACVLYILRAGVIERLHESGQRLLLNRLASLLPGPLGAHTPVAIVMLEGIALLTEVLGEISGHARGVVEGPVTAKVVGAHACLRVQVRK